MDDERLNVLLIEDVLIYTSLLKRLVIASDITLDSAESLALGLQKAAQNPYQAILLDLGLAGRLIKKISPPQ